MLPVTAASLWTAEMDGDDRQGRWAGELTDALAPYAIHAAPLNFLDDEGPEAVRAAYGAHYARLSELKAERDPQNLFRCNHNVPPASRRSAA